MNPADLNYRHLHYFRTAAHEGSFTRAAESLGIAVQTVSVQIGLLEQALGRTLLVSQGRRLVPTEAGRLALDYADRIFALGGRLCETLEDDALDSTVRLNTGLSDALPKLVAHRLLEGALQWPARVRLVCEEGDFDDLVAALAMHRLDVVLTDRPAASTSGVRVFNHPLGDCGTTLFGTPALAQRYGPGFPHSLHGAPVLLPTRGNALRERLDQWFAARDVRPAIAGEFEDAALLTTFGSSGLGLFPSPDLVADELNASFGLVAVGPLDGVREQFFAITAERRIRHPAVESLLAHAHRLHGNSVTPDATGGG